MWRVVTLQQLGAHAICPSVQRQHVNKVTITHFVRRNANLIMERRGNITIVKTPLVGVDVIVQDLKMWG